MLCMFHISTKLLTYFELRRVLAYVVGAGYDIAVVIVIVSAIGTTTRLALQLASHGRVQSVDDVCSKMLQTGIIGPHIIVTRCICLAVVSILFICCCNRIL